MVLILHVVGGLALVMSIAGIAYTVLAAATLTRLAETPSPRAAVPATLLKPLCGAEPGLEANLASFLRQDYGAPIQVIFGVQDSADPALAVAEAVRHAHPDAHIDVVVGPGPPGPNRKIANLINMLGHARHDFLVISDADMRATADYLARVAGAAGQPGVGAATCYYYGQGRTGFWSQIAAMGISYGFLPNVATGVGLGLAHPCMGSTIALRGAVLEEIGGFEAFAEVLADDYEIGRAVRARGLRVALPAFAIAHGCAEETLGEMFAHELRWAVTIRCMDPLGHAGSVVTHPLALAVIATLLLGGAWYAALVMIAAGFARIWLMRRTDRAVGATTGPWQQMLLRDILSFAVFACSLFARRVDWRGSKFHISANGKLSPA
ncbi:MAG: bacteriohopanetetrol glucosamine biosynthesis glycosyltransferase HpnI [Caulobacteraceae bacterium]